MTKFTSADKLKVGERWLLQHNHRGRKLTIEATLLQRDEIHPGDWVVKSDGGTTRTLYNVRGIRRLYTVGVDATRAERDQAMADGFVESWHKMYPEESYERAIQRLDEPKSTKES